ncbi:MAG: hypothetical protein NTW87_37025 [Planctomycetota bacterium]|nr:hypothetical protein [Planctomycetota bacterium]
MRIHIAAVLLPSLALSCCTHGAQDEAFFLDLSGAANMGFRDETAGDGVGGWTDQGGNDFRNMPVGEQTLCGVPFRIVDPARNGGKSCLVLRGHDAKTFPESARIAAGRKTAAVVFLHALGWGDEKPVANYVINYADGKSETIPIRQGKEILGWWGAQETDQVKIAVQSSNLASRTVCVHAWAWVNPRADVAIESIELKSTGSQGVPIIVAVTLLDKVPTLRSERPQRKVPPDGFVMIEAESFTSFNVPPAQDEKGADGKPAGKKVYGFWPDPRFSGGKLFEIKPPAALPQIGGEQPQYLKDGALKVTYEFSADKADSYVFWARVGPANVYSPFRWRVDDGEWGKITRKDPFLDMWDMAFWVTLGWVRLGDRRLDAGKHVLHVEVPKPETKEQSVDRAMDATLDELTGKRDAAVPGKAGKAAKSEAPNWGVMADCFAISRVPFHPCGALQAGEEINRIAWLDAPARDHILYLGDEKIAADGTRQRFSLNGLWEVARDPEPIPSPVENDEAKLRGPLTEPPDCSTLAWMGVNVPHIEERPETAVLHRRWYRKRVTLPADLNGKRVSLNFGETNYTASVFVNGKLCGTHIGGYVPFSVDVTAALKPGEVNEILVGIKGIAYYRKDYRPEIPWGFNAAFWRAVLAPGRTGWGRENHDGIFGSAWLETHGQVALHDLFVRAKYAARQIICSAELDNRAATAFSGKLRFSVLEPKTGEVVTVVGETAVQLEPGKSGEFAATGSAGKLTPWFPAQAKLYTIRAEVIAADGKALDVADDSFGYREIELRDKSFYINGQRCNFRSVLTGGKESLEESLAQWRAYNCNTMRLPDGGYNGCFGQDQSALLRWADELGIGVRYCSQINGMAIDLSTDDERFWKYSTDYLKQFVKAFRNHPSIIVWTAENELDLISNMGNDKTFKRREWELLRTAHELDPSRPVMGDGAGDLLGECEICNWHYCEVGPIVDPNDKQTMAQRGKEGVGAVYPEDAYTFARLSPQCESRPWDRKRPLWVGETYFYSGPVKWQCWIGGDEALAGRFAANDASARFVNMLVRGYRWQDTAGTNIFVHADQLPGTEIRNSLAPVAVFSRDYDRNQFAGGAFTRRLKVFNDTLDASPITLEWEFLVDGKPADSGKSEHRLEPGMNEETTIQVKTPPTPDRADATLRFRLSRGGAPVFEETHPLSVFARLAELKLPDGVEVRVFDPSGRVAAALERWKVRFTKLDRLDALPGNGLVIIGPDALKTAFEAALGKLNAFVAAGGRALVLEQNRAFPAKALPFPIEAQAADGSTACPRGAHPALEGVRKENLCVWGRDQVVYRWPFVRSAKWPLLVDASTKDAMNLAPVVETRWGRGHYLLSQLLIGEKLDSEPMAERLLAIFARYLATRPAKDARLASFAGKDDAFAFLLKDLGFTHRATALARGADMQLEAALGGGADTVLLPGNHMACDMLLTLRKPLGEFTARGGWVVVQGLDQQAFDTLSKVVGEELIYRPVRQERITVVRRDEPLMAGIGNHEFYWEQKLDEKTATELNWLFGDMPLRDDVLTGAVLYDDVCALTGNVALSNGLTSEDHWKYIMYAGDDPIRLDWRRPFDIFRVVVRENRHYKRIEEIALTLGDDKAPALKVEVPKEKQPHVFEFPPRKLSAISLQATKFKNLAAYGPMGWDTVEVYRTVSDTFRQRVVPLTNPAGVVKFPLGKGGILLNMTSVKDPRGIRVFAQLLHNLGVGRGPVTEKDSPAIDLEGKDRKRGDDGLDLGP